MDKFDELELNGRKLLESFLIQVGATNLHPTEDKFAPVDYYFTYKDKKVVAEIKVRDIKYEGYDTHLMEVSKYKSLVRIRKIASQIQHTTLTSLQMELKLMPIGIVLILLGTLVL